MTRSSRHALGALAVLLALVSAAPVARTRELPARLADAEFWQLVTDVSEPGGYFRITDNYTSNEGEIGRIFTMLRDAGVEGGVYVGVGPEQNLTYIAATRPAMAFIVDIRRQAVVQHLMFKAIAELARDRAEFISLLFAKPRPDGLAAGASIQQIWNAYFAVATDAALAGRTYERITRRLTDTHGFTLTDDERAQLRSVYDAFVYFGPGITTRGSSQTRGGGNNWSFADLTGWSYDAAGEPRSFLSSEDHFRTVKTLHERNLIVPVSGDFGGAKALGAIGSWVRRHEGVVRAFYVSNVEQYLFQDGRASAFYANVAALPIDERSVFIRPYSLRRSSNPTVSLCGIGGFLGAASAGRVRTNNEALACPQ